MIKCSVKHEIDLKKYINKVYLQNISLLPNNVLFIAALYYACTSQAALINWCFFSASFIVITLLVLPCDGESVLVTIMTSSWSEVYFWAGHWWTFTARKKKTCHYQTRKVLVRLLILSVDPCLRASCWLLISFDNTFVAIIPASQTAYSHDRGFLLVIFKKTKYVCIKAITTGMKLAVNV